MIIGQNQGSVMSIYAYLINFSQINQQKLFDFVSPVTIIANITEFLQIKTTNYVMISYGQKIKDVKQQGDIQLIIKGFCVYDFGNAQQLKDSQYGVNTLNVLQNPVICYNNTSYQITALENISMNDQQYLAFSLASKSLMIFEIKDLINSKFSITTAKKLYFGNYLNEITYMLQPPNLSLLIVGNSIGIITTFDISNQSIISQSNGKNSTQDVISLYIKRGMGLPGQITEYVFNENTQTVNILSKSYKSDSGITSNQLQQTISQYDLILLQKTSEQTYDLDVGGIFNKAQSTLENTVGNSDMSFISLTSTTKSYYSKELLVNQPNCPRNSPSTASQNTTTIKHLQIVVYKSSTRLSQEVDIKSDNLNISSLPGMLSYSSENNSQFVVFLAITKPFIFANYCELNSGRILLQSSNEESNIPLSHKNADETEKYYEERNQKLNQGNKKQKRILQDIDMNLHLFIYNNLGQQSFKTDSSFLTLTSLDQSPIQFLKDFSLNLLIIFNDKIVFVKPSLNTATSIISQQVSLEQLQQLIFNDNIKKIVKVSTITSLNHLVIQFDQNDDTQLSVILTYNVSWHQSDNKDLQLIEKQIFKDQNKFKSMLKFNFIFFIKQKSIIVIQYANNIDFYKYDQLTSSLTLHLTLLNSSDSFTKFFQLKNDNSLYTIHQDGEIKRIYAPACLDQSCINSSCSISQYMNQQKSNKLQDIQTQQSQKTNILIRQEQLLNQVLSYSILVNKIKNMEIKRSYYFASGSYYDFKFIHFKQIVSLDYLKLNQITLTLKIHAYDPNAPPDKKDEGLLKPVEVNTNDSNTFDNYYTLSIKNINWNVNQDNYPLDFPPLFNVLNNVFILDNVQMLSYSQIQNTQINDNIHRIQVKSGMLCILKNMVIKNKNYDKIDYFIKTPNSSFAIKMQNIQIIQNKFQNSAFIQANDLVTLKASNLKFINNVIIQNVEKTELSAFIQASSIQLEDFQFLKNSIQSIILIGKAIKSTQFTAKITQSEISKNIFFYLDDSYQVVFLNVEFLSYVSDRSMFNFTTVQISQNQILQKQYSQQEADNYLNNLDEYYNKSYPDNQIDDSDQTAIEVNQLNKIYLIQAKYIKDAIFNDVQFTDNHRIGFIQGSYFSNFSAIKLKCINTVLDQDIPNSSCIKITDYNKIIFEMIESEISNYHLQNDYLIYLKTSTFTNLKVKDSKDSKYDSSIKIDGLKIKNIKISTKTEYNQASTIFFNSLQKNQITLNNIHIKQVLLFTPLKVFFDMASCISLLTPFSTATLSNSSFINLYTQSIKETLYLNVEDLKLENNVFENNQFETKSTKKGNNGGFLSIRTGSINATNNSFDKGSSNYGGAITLIPTKINSIFTFQRCTFTNIFSSKNGGAVYIVEPPQSTTFKFDRCNFTSLLAQDGGSIYINYLLTDSQLQSEKSPTLQMISPRINQTFAYIQGSFVTALNINLNINDLILNVNDPNKSISIQHTLIADQIKKINQIGSLFFTINSAFVFKNSQLSNIHVTANQKQASIITLQQNSILTIDDVTMIEGSFSSSGCLLVESNSVINLKTVTISKMKNLQQVKLTKSDLNQIMEFLVSPFKIKTLSKFSLIDLNINENECNSDYCVGGGLSIAQSSGEIKNSNFKGNKSQNKGGAISILSPSDSVKIQNVLFEKNEAAQEGGALYIQTQSDKGSILISDNTRFLNNIGYQGGGLYLNCQYINSAKQVNDWLIMNDSTVMGNKAHFLGGGMHYEGLDPYISPKTKISDNYSGKSFSSNLFSRPVKFRLNQQLSMQSNNSNNMGFKVSKDINGIDIYELDVQTSGQSLPDLIIELIDENDQIVDNSYQDYIKQSIFAYLSHSQGDKGKELFQIVETTENFVFNNYFNLTAIKIRGLPNQSISLKLTSPIFSNSKQPENNYYIIFNFKLRECIRGEVYKQIQNPVHGSNSFFYECLKCPPGYYSLQVPSLKDPIFECQKCKETADCEGGDKLSVHYGYWRESEHTDEIHQCVNRESNCLGGECTIGHVGPLCESCDIENGYSRQGNFQCSECGDPLTNSFKVIGLVILYIVSAKLSVDGVLEKIMEIFKNRKQIKKQAQKEVVSSEAVNKYIEQQEHNTSILLKLIINYFQVVLVITTFQISIPNFFNNPIEVVANPTVQVLYSFECFFHQISVQTNINIIYVQLIASVSLMIICALVFIITGLISYRNNPYLRRFYITTSLIYCLMYFQPSIYKDAISIISCRVIGGNSYIQYNVLYECYTEEHILWSLSLVFPILLILIIIIPGALFYRIYRVKNSYLRRKNFTFLIGEYKERTWFWEFIKMYLKLLIMSFLTIYEYAIPNKILFILLTMALYGLLLFKYKPYNNELYNTIDKCSTAVLIVSIYLGFVAYENQNSLAWKLSIFIAIAAINTFFLIWCMKQLAQACLPIFKREFFKLKFKIFKLLPCKCFYTNRTQRIYKFQRWVKSVQKELKKRNIINAWTGKIKVPLEDIIELIIKGREMKNMSKTELNTSIKDRTSTKKQTTVIKVIKIEEPVSEIQQIQQNDNTLKINDLESIQLEFPSENQMCFSPQNYQSQNNLTAQIIPYSFQNQNEVFKDRQNAIKSQTSILLTKQESHTNNYIELLPLQSQLSKTEDNISPFRLLITPTTKKSNEQLQYLSPRKISVISENPWSSVSEDKNISSVKIESIASLLSMQDVEVAIEYNKEKPELNQNLFTNDEISPSHPSLRSLAKRSTLKKLSKDNQEIIELESETSSQDTSVNANEEIVNKIK